MTKAKLDSCAAEAARPDDNTVEVRRDGYGIAGSGLGVREDISDKDVTRPSWMHCAASSAKRRREATRSRPCRYLAPVVKLLRFGSPSATRIRHREVGTS